MLFAQFARVAARVPATAGLRHDGVTTPYAAVAERAARLAAGLRSAGIDRGMPVGLLLPNSPDLFAAVYALFALGAIVVPLPLSGTGAELARMGRACRLGAIIARDDQIARAHALRDMLEGAPQVIGTEAGPLALHALGRAAPLAMPEVSGDTDALYLFSSGSTGRPKVVPHTHAELVAEGLGVGEAEGLSPDDVVLNTLPAHHGFGFMTAHLEAALAGATTVYWSDTRPLLLARGALAEAIGAEGVTVLPGVPFMFDALAGAPGAADLSGLRLAFTCGIALRESVREKTLARYGISLRQAYGSTEAGQIAFNTSSDPQTWRSVGPAQSNARFTIAPLPGGDGETGEILISGPSVARGYLDAEGASREAFRDGWFHSGDLGHFDAGGRLHITGRSKLIVEVAGYKVDPIEVEDVLCAHPAIAEAVVVGVPDSRTGEQRLKLFAVLRDTAAQADLVGFARERLAAYKVPETVEFIDAIPRSATGKVLRGRLIEGG